MLSDQAAGCARDADTVPAEPLPLRILPRGVRRVLVLRAFQRTLTLPLPSLDVEPRESVSLPLLLERWHAVRAEMGRVLNTVRADQPRYLHPILGLLTAGQMLAMELAQTAYHARRITARQTESLFPRPVTP